MKLLRAVIATLVVLALICGACAVVALKSLTGLAQDAYASDWTAIFVIEHLKSSNNSWPASWDDLRDEFDRMAEPTHYAWTFSELQERVDLRFDVTAEEVRDSDPPLVISRLTSGRHVNYFGDPNHLIREYLRTGQGGTRSLRLALPGTAPQGQIELPRRSWNRQNYPSRNQPRMESA